MAEDIDALLKRAERADGKRAAMAELMREVYAYIMPERDQWNSYGIGQSRHVRVYDSSGIASATRFANRLQATVFPPGQRWAELSLPAQLTKGSMTQGQRQLQEDLELATEIVFHHVQASNFDAEMNGVSYDVGAGMGAMLVENGRRVSGNPGAPLLLCQAVSPSKLAFDDGPWGNVEGVFLSQSIPGRLLMRTYADATLPADLSQQIDANGEADVDLLQATTFDAKQNDWHFRVVHKASKSELVSRRYRTNPWVIIRWARVPGESHGRGVFLQALGDVRTANKLMELMLIAGSYNADPSYTVADDGVINTDVISVLPGQYIPVRSNGGTFGPSIKMLEGPSNLQFSDLLLDRMHTRVRQLMFDNPLPPEVQVGLTATEIIERMRLYQQDTGSIGRLHQDGAVPLMLRFVDVLEEAGEFPPDRLPQLLKALQGRVVQIRVVSPISRSQDQADLQALMSVIAGAQHLGEFGLQMLQAGVDARRAGVFVAQRSGIPTALIPTEEETAARLKAERDAMQQQLLATSPVAAQVAGAVAGGVMNGATQQAAPAEAA